MSHARTPLTSPAAPNAAASRSLDPSARAPASATVFPPGRDALPPLGRLLLEGVDAGGTRSLQATSAVGGPGGPTDTVLSFGFDASLGLSAWTTTPNVVSNFVPDRFGAAASAISFTGQSLSLNDRSAVPSAAYSFSWWVKTTYTAAHVGPISVGTCSNGRQWRLGTYASGIVPYFHWRL